MGRALARQLVAEGCDVAMCDILEDNLVETRRLCETEASQGRVISTSFAMFPTKRPVNDFRDAVKREHDTDHIDLLFNNAGVGAGASFVDGRPRQLGAHLQHLLVRRLFLRPRLHADAAREQGRAHGEHLKLSTVSGPRSAPPARTVPTAPPSSR